MTPAETRQRVCHGLSGDVLELGFGSGLNVPHYPASISTVLAVEPNDVGFRMAGKRLAQGTVPVQRIGLDGARLPLPGLQQRMAGGCHINRPIDRLVADAGFTVERMENSYEKGAPKPMGYLFEGAAVA